jgi:hypothetical protein
MTKTATPLTDSVRARLAQRRRELTRKRQAEAAAAEAASTPPAVTPRYVSPPVFAERSGVHLATVYRRIHDGTLRCKKLIGKGKTRGRFMIDASELDLDEAGQ